VYTSRYFKEIRNIYTGELVEINQHKSDNIVNSEGHGQDKSLSPFAQNFIPVGITEIRPTNVNIPPGQERQIIQTNTAQYCGQEYDVKHAWKDLQLEREDYNTLRRQ